MTFWGVILQLKLQKKNIFIDIMWREYYTHVIGPVKPKLDTHNKKKCDSLKNEHPITLIGFTSNDGCSILIPDED